MSEKDKHKIEIEPAQPEALPQPSGQVEPQAAEHERPEAECCPAAEDEAAAAEEAEAAEQSRIQELEAQVEELKDKYLRALAELDNFRRRAQEERVRQIQYANERLLRELLPVVDDLERALAAENSSLEALRRGVELILDKLRHTLQAFGVEPLESVGQSFDPYLHEAVDRVVTAEVPEGTIVQEHQRGYTYHERLLRPARVSVAVAPVREAPEGDAEET